MIFERLLVRKSIVSDWASLRSDGPDWAVGADSVLTFQAGVQTERWLHF